MIECSSQLSLDKLRQLIRSNTYTGSTSGLASGYLQANLVILPKEWANDFYYFVNVIPSHVL